MMTPALTSIAIVLHRELTPDEIERVETLRVEGVTDICAVVEALDPSRSFYAWERIVLNATLSVGASAPASLPEGDHNSEHP